MKKLLFATLAVAFLATPALAGRWDFAVATRKAVGPDIANAVGTRKAVGPHVRETDGAIATRKAVGPDIANAVVNRKAVGPRLQNAVVNRKAVGPRVSRTRRTLSRLGSSKHALDLNAR